MKIGPCKDEFAAFVFLLLFSLVMFGAFYTAEIAPYSATEDAILLAVTIFLCAMAEAVSVSSMLYFGRTITLDSEGCCFSFRGFEKKYRWEELDVQYYENDHSHSRLGNREADGPGILINVKGRKYNPKWAAMTYCYTFHPMTSVFLRFRGPKDDLKSWKFNHTIVGYTIKREELLAVLEELGQCPEVPEIQYRP